MKVLLINVVCGIGSTGKICLELAKSFEAERHEVKIAYGRDNVPIETEKYAIKIGSAFDQNSHGVRTRLLDQHGFGSKKATEKFLFWAEQYHPDLLWLHNIHGYYLNVEMLFRWIKKHPEMQVKWTLHDCWAFTGHCTHFIMAGCEQWKQGCHKCVQKKRYPSSLWIDNCEENYRRKKVAFTGVENMTLITPSQWLAGLVRESFIGGYPVEIQYNRINTNIFKPTSGNFRKRYHLEKRKMLLGVASAWDERKGLYDFIRLTGMLDDSYVIVLVGLTEKQCRKVMRLSKTMVLPEPDKNTIQTSKGEWLKTDSGIALPADVRELYYAITGMKYLGIEQHAHAGLLCLPATNNSGELAEIYTAADLFINPTYEDNYPTVNLEAIACGTKVLTYDTGGCRETLNENAVFSVKPERMG